MHILLISGLYPPHVLGGAETVAHVLARGLTARGHDVRVLSTAPYHGPRSLVPTISREGGVRVARFYPANLYHLPAFRSHGPMVRALWQAGDLWNPHVWLVARRLLRRWRPDVVHVHHLAGISAAPVTAAARAGVPIMATVHDHALFCVYGSLRRPGGETCPVQCRLCAPLRSANRALMAPVARVVGPSAYILEEHRRRGFFPTATWHVVPNGIARTAETPPPRDRGPAGLRAAFIGRLEELKGVRVLLDALRLRESTGISVDLAGAGPLLDECRALEASTGALHVLGRISPPERTALLARSDVVVVPSTCPECLPTVIAEAYAAGLPVIASRIGGIVEMVEEGETGLLVPPGDPVALAGALDRFRYDRVLWQRCAAGARRAAARYDLDTFLATTETLYLDMSRSRPRP